MQDSNDSEYKARAKRIIDGKSVELMSPLHLNLASSGRLLPSYIDLRIVLYRNPDDLILMDLNGNGSGYKVVFEDLRLYVREVELLDSVSLALEKTLASGHAMKFPIKNVQMRSFHIPAGGYQLSPTVIHNTSIPRKVIVGLVSTEAYNGLLSKDPLKFSNYSLKNISIESGGRTFPDSRIDTDYDRGNYVRSFIQLYEGLNMTERNTSMGISFDSFADDHNLYVFNISPCSDNESFDLISAGTTSLRMEFKSPIPSGGVTVIVYSEFQNLLSIDTNRNVTFDNTI
uniref:CUB_2 domain-containing protein n=1 Tax=Steinernema glaseri TaxID=37863 RepID=A0A1I7YWB4_9BILA